MSFLAHYWRSLHDYLDRHGDVYINQRFLMSSPFPTLAMCLVYVYAVKILGPRLMADRKPFGLKKTLILYNFAQVALSGWLFYEFCVSGWLTGDYNWHCQPMDPSGSPLAMRMRRVAWWYFFSKFSEFFDTFFFIMRKKYGQVSTLHVIHHSIMPCLSWYGLKFSPNGHGTFFGLLNTFVHTIMYSYYLLAALGPQVQKYLWWKKYLTAMQLAQFTAVILHATQVLVFECDYPKQFAIMLNMGAIMFFVLFKAFYAQSYSKPALPDQSKAGDGAKVTAVSFKQDGDSLKQNNDSTAIVHRRHAASSESARSH